MLKRGAEWRKAFRSVVELIPRPVRRVMGFDAKGLVSLVLLVARRRHGVPKGGVALSYSGAQTTFQLAFLFAMLMETIVVELLLRGVDAPEGLRAAVLMIDVYSILIVLAVIAACVTRPHVLTNDELRIRYGAFFDLRVPRGSISAVRVARNYDERGLVKIQNGKLSIAVAAQTNVIVELDAPIAVVRPLGGAATARAIRFYADDPAALTAVLTGRGGAVKIQEAAGRRDSG